MSIVIIKYNAGNIFSVDSALKRLNVEAIITDDKEKIRNADKVIFPGVGEAATTMKYLRETKLDEVIINLKQPVFGICIGMQLLCKHSQEGDVDCLGVFDCDVEKMTPSEHSEKIPHMGWNTIYNLQSPLFDKQQENSFVYYVHSYCVPINKYTIATTDYIKPFSAAMQKDNFYSTQFHPEKSSDIGHSILQNFLNL